MEARSKNPQTCCPIYRVEYGSKISPHSRGYKARLEKTSVSGPVGGRNVFNHFLKTIFVVAIMKKKLPVAPF